MPDNPLLEEIENLKKKIKHYSTLAASNSVGKSEKSIYEDNVQRLRDELFDKELKIPVADRVSPKHVEARDNAAAEAKMKARTAKAATTRLFNKAKAATAGMNAAPKMRTRAEQAAETKKFEEEAKEYARTHPAAQEQFQQIRKQVQGVLSPAQGKNKPKVELTPQDKKILDSLKSLGQTKPRRFGRVAFNLPQFTTNNSTSIVLACILIIFFLELHAGTKFVALWNDAFSPGSSTSKNTGSQNHTNLVPKITHPDILPRNTMTNTEQNLSAFDSPFAAGAGTMLDYGVPESFHYLEGAVW